MNTKDEALQRVMAGMDANERLAYPRKIGSECARAIRARNNMRPPCNQGRDCPVRKT